jgi:hypothetical protein
VDLYIHSPIRLHGVVLNSLSTGTTLPYLEHTAYMKLQIWCLNTQCTMERPQVANEGDSLQFWRVAVNILNKQSRTASRGWSSSWGVGREANNSSP